MKLYHKVSCYDNQLRTYLNILLLLLIYDTDHLTDNLYHYNCMLQLIAAAYSPDIISNFTASLPIDCIATLERTQTKIYLLFTELAYCVSKAGKQTANQAPTRGQLTTRH